MARIEMLGSALEMSVAQRKVKKQIYELEDGTESQRCARLVADVLTKKNIIDER
jgi:hypothetical protein